MDEEIENQKYQIRKDSSSEKSKEFPSPELVNQIHLTNVELRRIQLEKQLKITPFQSGLRSSLTARNINRLPPPNNNLKKKHPQQTLLPMMMMTMFVCFFGGRDFNYFFIKFKAFFS
uniref:Uncharacterized protein n=1 Tax=Meloidogyne enterolobii TaxID=390850 RepID=A0A6V7XMQ6_MELEN|nr:unnamed protein product [Meloidogyne enterolobii]